jgi:hypothetical protein
VSATADDHRKSGGGMAAETEKPGREERLMNRNNKRRFIGWGNGATKAPGQCPGEYRKQRREVSAGTFAFG